MPGPGSGAEGLLWSAPGPATSTTWAQGGASAASFLYRIHSSCFSALDSYSLWCLISTGLRTCPQEENMAPLPMAPEASSLGGLNHSFFFPLPLP